MSAPLRPRRCAQCAWLLICLWMNILWQRRTGLIGQTISGLTFQQSQTRFDMNVVGVQVRGSRICVECIARLVITRFILKLR
jgi:predicted Rdx family selenoprotein